MCLNAGAMGRQDAESETLIPVVGGGFDVAHSLRADGFDASEDGTGRGTPIVPVLAHAFDARHANGGGQLAVAQPYTLAIRGRGDTHNLEYRQDGTANAILTPNGGRAGIGVGAIAFAQNSRDEVRMQGGDGEIAGALAAEPGIKQTTYIAFDTTQITSAANYSAPKIGDPVHPLAAGSHAPALAFNIYPASGQDSDLEASETEIANSVSAVQNGNMTDRGTRVVEAHSTWAVRRLTPRECERLQGFRDDYTAIPRAGKPASECADGPRYKALGNSWAVPCVAWIGRRITEHWPKGSDNPIQAVMEAKP